VEGIGKKLFAVWIAKYLLCEKGTPLFSPCDCPSCLQADNGSHPDIHIFSEEKKKSDKEKDDYAVDNIRAIAETAGSTSYSGRWKIIILDGAHRLSSGGQNTSANALLKTLEEPGADTVFFLITHRPQLLLPTILSRCQTIRFNPLSIKDLEAICIADNIKYNQDLLLAAGGSVSNLLSLAKFDIKGFIKAVETADTKELAAHVFSMGEKDRTAAVLGNLREHLIHTHGAADEKYIGFIQYLDKFIRDFQDYNLNTNIMLLDLYANLTEYIRK
jgi:DNA polymerase-3 subunit delta'